MNAHGIQSYTELLNIHGLVEKGQAGKCRLAGARCTDCVQGKTYSGSQASCLPFPHRHNTGLWLQFLIKQVAICLWNTIYFSSLHNKVCCLRWERWKMSETWQGQREAGDEGGRGGPRARGL